jgi:hypothetical protein
MQRAVQWRDHLILESAALSERYSVYIDHLLQKYADEVAPL